MRRFFLSALLILGACSHPESTQEDAFDSSLCTEAEGYELGKKDGQANRAMDTRLYRCREGLMQKAIRGYRDGYEQGLKMRDEPSRRQNATPKEKEEAL